MTNNRDKIDDLFRENLDGYRVEPSQGLWGRIEDRFFTASGRSRAVLLSTILIAILAGSALVTWYFLPDHRPVTTAKDKVTTEELSVSTPVQQPTTEMESHENEMESHKNEMESHTNKIESRLDITTQTAADNKMAVEEKIDVSTHRMNADRPFGISYTGRSFDEAYYMKNLQGTLLLEQPGEHAIPSTRDLGFNVPVRKGLQDIYAPKYELYAGASFMPSVIFYDPNPNNNGWSAGMDLQYSNSKLNLYLGVGVSKFKDKGSWQVNYKSYDSVGYYTNITSFRVDPADPGNIIFVTKDETVYDSVPHVSITERTNTYTYFDIPASIGLTFLEKSRISLTLKTGIRFSALLSKNEPTADLSMPEASEIEIIRKVPARFNTSWRFTASMEASLLLTDRLKMFLEPSFEQYLNSVYTDQENYHAKKPYLIGMNVGMKYRIR